MFRFFRQVWIGETGKKKDYQNAEKIKKKTNSKRCNL